MKLEHLGGSDTYYITDFDVNEFPIPKVRAKFPNGFDRIIVHHSGDYTLKKAYVAQSWGDMESLLLEDKESLAIIASFIMDYMQIEKERGRNKN